MKSTITRRLVVPQLMRIVIIGTALCFFAAAIASAQTESVLYSFTGGTDGWLLYGGVTLDPTGNLYGTTAVGGKCRSNTNGCGVVFQLHPDGSESVLHTFIGAPHDGSLPRASVVRDLRGNLYGTTTLGGTNDLGTVFRISPTGGEKLLHSFGGGTDGRTPQAALLYANGYLYGTTSGGGSGTACTAGCGTIFEIAPNGEETVLYSFVGGRDGANPIASLIRDSEGNLYGTTFGGGAYGQGTVFKLTPTGVETVLYTFTGGADGGVPYGGLVKGNQGNLYGTTSIGGLVTGLCPNGCGTVFQLTPQGVETILHTFGDGQDGRFPLGTLVRGSNGYFYGITSQGGKNSCGCGTVFLVTGTGGGGYPIYAFGAMPDGAYPFAGLAIDKNGNLYGTTEDGGTYNRGAVFKVTW